MRDAAAGLPAIELEAVDKTYRLYRSPRERLLDQIGLARLLGRGAPPEFDALRGVSLSVRKGERLGIVGRNGAGKTTLLKLITGNFAPTRGRITVRGAVQALMRVGLGFYPNFTGYENARSALLYNGLSSEALEAAVADVVDFCELGEFLHQPLSTYSLGMRMRLQFATATAIRPEILVIDEVMGAGDAYFSAKSAERMKRLTQSGCTLLLVSHSPYQVLEFCDHAIWLDDGAIRMAGDANTVLGAYEVYIEQLSAADAAMGRTERSHLTEFQAELDGGRKVFRWPGKTGVKVAGLSLTDGFKEISRVAAGGAAFVEMDLIAEREGTYECSYLITFWSERMRRVARVESGNDQFVLRAGERRRMRANLSPVLLRGGRYHLSVSVYDRSAGQPSGAETRFDVLARSLSLEVEGGAVPPFYIHPAKWSFQ